jgi:hypothetical protein
MLSAEVLPMNRSLAFRVASVVTIVLVLVSPALAQSSSPFKLEGTISDYTDAENTAGPWHISGEWSAQLRGFSGRVDVIASLAMVRSASGGSSHTHHIALLGARVTPIAGGYRLSGEAVITTSGTLAAFSGSPLDVDVIGGSALPLSNVKLTFGGAATTHFGSQPIEGVVAFRR